MSQGDGKISYNQRPTPDGEIFEGARNGLSVDAGHFVVLGQVPGDPLNPAIILDNRIVPMNNMFINFQGGPFVISDTPSGPISPLARLQVLVNDDPGGNAIALFSDESDFTDGIGVIINGGPAGPSNINGPQLLAVQRAGHSILTVNGSGVIQFNDTRDGISSVGNAAFSPTFYLGRQLENDKNSCLNINSFWQPLSTPGFPQGLSDILISSSVEFNTTDVYDYAAFRFGGNIDQTGGSGTFIRGVFYQPNVIAVTQAFAAFENTVGNVLMCTDTANPNVGTVSIRLGSLPNVASAYLQIGGGQAAAGNAPLKLTAGTLLTVPEDGAIEYDGTNFYKTIGATRTVIL
jgi:hypothetical protein